MACTTHWAVMDMASHAELMPGNAVVRWQVLALDGHITRGEVAFTVLER